MNNILTYLTRAAPIEAAPDDLRVVKELFGHIPPNGDADVRLSASQAGVILRACQHPLQVQARKHETQFGKDHIANLANAMRTGRWRDGDRLDLALLNGQYLMLNGMHRTHGQNTAGVTLTWNFKVHPVKTEQEFLDLFATFDFLVRKRPLGVVMDMIGTDMPVSKTVRKAAERALPLIVEKFAMGRKGRDKVLRSDPYRRTELAATWAPEIVALDKYIADARGALKRKLLAEGVVAVALVTFRHSPVWAAEFWSAVAQDNGLQRGDARKTLVTALQDHELNAGHQHLGTIYAALAWNAFTEGRSIKSLRVTANSILTINETPYRNIRSVMTAE